MHLKFPSDTALLLLHYNRPNSTRLQLEALCQFSIEKVYLYIDGPKTDLVRNNQDEILSIIDEFNSITIEVVRRPVNLGLRRSVITSITELFNDYDKVIILEDDCIPLDGFFDYMLTSLQRYENQSNIRSICSYHFPGLDTSGESTSLISRFIPWGWATWRNRWNEYDTSLPSLIKRVFGLGIYLSLPEDVRYYIDQFQTSEDGSDIDIWSINWVLLHYLSETYALYPPSSLVSNIGFDGSGVHCFITEAFKSTQDKFYLPFKIDYPTTAIFNEKFDADANAFMETHWLKTMYDSKDYSSFTDELSISELEGAIDTAVNHCPIVDVHTHLFPDVLGDYYLEGIDSLLTYHYLVSEYLSSSGYDAQAFNMLCKEDQAKLIWNYLFIQHTPFSESCRGILSILKFFNINAKNKSYETLKALYNDSKLTSSEILDKLNITQVVMTNDPTNFNEWELFQISGWRKDFYKASIRLDQLLESDDVLENCFKHYHISNSNLSLFDKLNQLLDLFLAQSNFSYAAISLDSLRLNCLLDCNNFTKVVLPWLEKNDIPLALMLGVERSVNSYFGLGGDGVGNSDVDGVRDLCQTYPHNKFLVTVLDQNQDRKLTILSKKFPNLTSFGFWWFCNYPENIASSFKSRIQLIGHHNFVPQHSDSRVFEHLIYKWFHFKAILKRELLDEYKHLYDKGWRPSRQDIYRDVNFLMYENPALKFNINF